MWPSRHSRKPWLRSPAVGVCSRLPSAPYPCQRLLRLSTAPTTRIKEYRTLPVQVRLLWVVVILFGLVPVLRGQSVAELRQRGIQAFQSGRFTAAVGIFSELVRQDPSAAAYNYLAAAEGAAGSYRQAITDFSRSIQLGNDTPDLRYDLALAYLKENRPAAGIRELQVALARQPGFTRARYTLGVALLRTNHPREALDELAQVRSRLAGDPEMWTNLVHAQFATGDTAKALETTGAATRALPDDSRLAAALAKLCLTYHRPQRARELLENASEASPQDNGLKLLLAEASLKADEPAETLAVLKNVPANAGAPGLVIFLRGRAFMLGGKTKEAERLISSALASDPRNGAYLSTYAELATSRKNYDAALATLRRAQHLEPRNPEYLYQTAVVYVLMRRYTDAEMACKEATGFDEKFDQAYFLLGAIELDRGAPTLAENAFRRAVVMKPASPLYHSALGAALFGAGRLAESQKAFDHALRLDPKTAAAYYWRAQLFARQREPKRAIQDLEAFVALDPHYADAYQQLAQLYVTEGKGVKASAANANYAALKDKSSPEQVPFFLTQLGTTRFRQAHNPGD